MAKIFIPVNKVILSEGEINAAVEVLKSGHLRQGKKTQEFEEAFARKVGAKYAIAVSSGTAALHIGYLSLLNPQDEVIVPSFTFIATASMIVYAKGKPIFCDVHSRTFTLDIEDARKRLTKKTKLIAPVHLFGNACDIEKINNFAQENNLRILWDAAQAHGTKYKERDIGSFDDLVCYSFYPTKNMTTGEGGMITTNNRELYEKCKLLRSHWQTEKYYHPHLGFNYRMTDVEAAIGVKQLEKLDEFILRRRENAAYLNERLRKIEEITLPFVNEGVEHSYHQYTILLHLNKLTCTRDEFKENLKDEGVGSAVHYPLPLHKQPVFKKMCGEISLPVSEDLSNRVLSLPVYPQLSNKELEVIAIKVEKVILKFRKR
jgi:perosamine synthetase